jgi:uncharacterized protein (TIGR03083 family)
VRLHVTSRFDPRPLLTEERAALLILLADLGPSEWNTATGCPGWSVKDVCLHLLDADFGWLSRGRDGDLTSLIAPSRDYRVFVEALNEQNERFVAVNRGWSPRLIRELLTLSGQLVDDYFAEVDLEGGGAVIWAGPEPVPGWLDMARDFTERWVHQQQIRDALARPGLSEARFLGPVLRTFVWALPHQYSAVVAPEGTEVELSVTGPGGGTWTLTRVANRWDLADEEATSPVASATVASSDAWRLFTAALPDPSRVHRKGDPRLADHLLGARAIIV